MSFSRAKQILADNLRLLDPKNDHDAVLYNISNGLATLCDAIEDELQRIKKDIDHVRSEVQSRR